VQVLADRRGATAIEYGLIAALIAIAMIGALKGVASQSSLMWSGVAANVSAASS
jgi:pilus assembly protein Flp/PilA